jgi:hypothetical protein
MKRQRQWPNEKNDKRTNNDRQNIAQKNSHRVARTQLKPGVNSGAPEG